MSEFANEASLSACSACGCTSTERALLARDWIFLRATDYSLIRCRKCHLCWLENPPSPNEMSAHYGTDYDKIITAPGDMYPHHWDVVREKLLKYACGGSVLDIGCSAGSFLKTLKGPSWRLYGIEMSREVADKARAATGAEVFVGDVLDAKFPDSHFDAVTAFHVLEHMYEPQRVMKKVFGWLKPGGVFTLTLPNIDSLEARIFGRYWFGLDTPRHLWQFSPTALSQMASFAGFKTAEMKMTARSCYFEGSLQNLLTDLKLRCGASPTPRARRARESSPIVFVRKAFRATFVSGFRKAAGAMDAGADIHAVFRKPLGDSEMSGNGSL